MPTFESPPTHEHGLADSLGILLVNLGTPDAPTPEAVRRYLREFLWDPRVVEAPRLLWWLVLHGFILNFRPARSARAYAKIWTRKGSPLLLHSESISRAIEARLKSRLQGSVNVVLGMSYGSPSIVSALDTLYEHRARRILCLPLYPQYSGTTSASVFDAVTGLLQRRRWVPEFRFISHYHDQRGYIAALAQSLREYWEQRGRGDHLLFSFHGLPKVNLALGDPYHCQCQKTARLVAAELDLDDSAWTVAFQSRVGRQEWLRPYADETIAAFGSKGMRRLDVICPGFAADCLETLEEIAMQNAELFQEHGGGSLHYVPALNARDDHVDFLVRLIERHLGGWPEASMDWSDSDSARELARSRERAIAMGASE